MDYKKSLESAENIADIFELVKKISKQEFGTEHAGLLVSLSDLGAYSDGFVGAYYSLDANAIVINKRPLAAIRHSDSRLYKPYLFYILLHEYLHSLGILDEEQVRMVSYSMSRKYLGGDHIASRMAANFERFMPGVMLGSLISGPEDASYEFIEGIDRESTDYIG